MVRYYERVEYPFGPKVFLKAVVNSNKKDASLKKDYSTTKTYRILSRFDL